MPIKISIIISTYSEKRLSDLVDLLENIKIQSYEYCETIIVVDENKKLLNKIESLVISNNYISSKVVFNPVNKGLSNSRNIGISYSTGNIISFIDDDAIPDIKWAETIVKTFNNNEIGAVTGDIVPLWENKGMSWFPNELYWMISCSYMMTPDYKCEVERGFGTNMSFKRDLIEKIGMFNIDLGIKGKNWVGGEDTDMFLKVSEAGKKVIFDPEARVMHKIFSDRIKLNYIAKRAFNGGRSVAMMKKVRRYNIKNSTEGKYLKSILLHYYPNKLKVLFKSPCSTKLKQIAYVSIVIFFEGIGYLFGIVMKK